MPKPVIALVGDEPFLQLQKLQQIIAQFPSDVQRIDLDGTRAELADALRRLFASPALRARLSAGAVEHASRFGWGSTVDRLLSVYRGAMTAPAEGRPALAG